MILEFPLTSGRRSFNLGIDHSDYIDYETVTQIKLPYERIDAN
jgi:hypothetical protein